MQNVLEEFNPKSYESQMVSLIQAVQSYCKFMGVKVKVIDRRDPLEENCGNWRILGANAKALCHRRDPYENDPEEVDKQMESLLSENCSIFHWASTARSSAHHPIDLKAESNLLFARIAQKFCPTISASVTIF